MSIASYEDMATSSPSFLDTEQEHDRWHHGLYKGLKIQRPDTLAKEMKIHGKNWRDWYSNDDHYHDFAMLGAYGFKGAAFVSGVYGLIGLGLI